MREMVSVQVLILVWAVSAVVVEPGLETGTENAIGI